MSDANLRSLQNGGVAVPSPLARHTNRGLTVDVSHKELQIMAHVVIKSGEANSKLQSQ
jgi:hypothetical protein